jgi:serine/threonine protein phosphatase PrpC
MWQALSSEPEISFREIGPTDRFLLLACDGVWDVMSDESAVRVVNDNLKAPQG